MVVKSWSILLVVATLSCRDGLAFAPQASDDDAALAAMDPLSRQLLFPRKYEVVDPEYASLKPEVVHFENSQGAMLRGLWFECASSDATVLTCMGNTGNASWMVSFAAMLHGAGFDVLLFDYQGFGPSEGVASLLALPGDALAAWTFLTSEKGRRPDQIGVLGISLGSVLALQLAAEQQPRACAVEDVFFPDRQLDGVAGGETTPGVKIVLAGLKALVLPRIDPRLNAAKFKGPLFLMHGDLDWLLPPLATVELSEQRHENRRVWILARTGHSPDSLQIDEWEYRDQIAGFFRDAFALPEQGRLAEPSAAFEVVSGPDEPPRVKVTVTASSSGPVQVTLAATGEKGEPLFHHERRLVAVGATTFECSPPFAPRHVTVIAARNAKLLEDATWERKLSPLSQSLAQFERVAGESNDHLRAVIADAANDKRPWDQAALLRDGWSFMKQRLPAAADVHPRARPRYASELALFAARFAVSSEDSGEASHAAAIEAAEAMLPFLPPDPRNFVTLGNATIGVGFDDPGVVLALTLLRDARRSRGDEPGAAAVERELAKYPER